MPSKPRRRVKKRTTPAQRYTRDVNNRLSKLALKYARSLAHQNRKLSKLEAELLKAAVTHPNWEFTPIDDPIIGGSVGSAAVKEVMKSLKGKRKDFITKFKLPKLLILKYNVTAVQAYNAAKIAIDIGIIKVEDNKVFLPKN